MANKQHSHLAKFGNASVANLVSENLSNRAPGRTSEFVGRRNFQTESRFVAVFFVSGASARGTRDQHETRLHANPNPQIMCGCAQSAFRARRHDMCTSTPRPLCRIMRSLIPAKLPSQLVTTAVRTLFGDENAPLTYTPPPAHPGVAFGGSEGRTA